MRLSTALGHFRQAALPAPQAEESYMTGRMFGLFALAKITINSQQKKYSPKTLKEAFGEKLRCAGVDVTAVRVQGTIHDFVMLNALDETNACRTAMDASTEWINRKAVSHEKIL